MSLRRQAVDLYETTPGATVRGIAQDLGISRGTLREWLHRWGTGRKTGPDGAPAPSPLKPKTGLTGGTAVPAPTGTQTPAQAGAESMEERVARPSGGERRLAGGAGQADPGAGDLPGRRPSMFRGGDDPVEAAFPVRRRPCSHLSGGSGCASWAGVARSSYYAWKQAAPRRAERAAADAALTERIRQIIHGDRAMGALRTRRRTQRRDR